MPLRLMLALALLVIFGGSGLLTLRPSDPVRVASVSEGSPSPTPTPEARIPATPTPTGTARALPTPTSTAHSPNPPARTVPAATPTVARPPSRPGRMGAATPGSLMESLAGFSGKTNQQRQAYIAERLYPDAGLTDITLQRVYYSGVWGEEYGNWDGLYNVIGVRRGSLPDGQRKRIVVGAHYDKVTYPWRSSTPGHSDGILDNATGTALLARIAQDIPQPQHDLVVIGFATEEPPPYFNGSKTYFGALTPQEREEVLVYVNLDVLGRGDLAMVTNSSPAIAGMAQERSKAEGFGLTWRQVSGNVASDHLSALAYGIPVLALTCTDYEARDIHVPEDTIAVIDPAAYFRHYAGVRAIVEALDNYFAPAQG